MISRGPPATVLGAVGVGASHQLLGLPHIRRVDEFLQPAASRPQPLLFLRLKRRCGLTTCNTQRLSLLCWPERPFNRSELVLVRPPLRELRLRPIVIHVERALSMIRKALARDAPCGLSLGQSLACGLATNSARHRTADSSHRLLSEPCLEVQACEPIASRRVSLSGVSRVEGQQV